MEEIWKDVISFEELYEVSNLGNIKNKKRGKILKTFKNCRGYLLARLYKNGKYYSKAVHRLVAMAFLDIFPFEIVNHIDGNKLNNNFLNLEKSSSRENTTHYYKNKLTKKTGTHFRKDRKKMD